MNLTGKSKKDIVKRLLRDAGYYWYDDNKTSVNPINPEHYDPAIDKIFKANAFEIQKLYKEIENSQQEVIQGFCRVLIPDEFALPEPAYTVAQIQPKFSRLTITPEDVFEIMGQNDQGEEESYFFTSLFNHDYPRCEMRYLFTNGFLLDTQERPSVEMDSNGLIVDTYENTKYIWLGLDIAKTEPGDEIVFYLGNGITDEFDLNVAAFHHSRWYVNEMEEHELDIRPGLYHYQKDSGDKLTDQVNILDSYEKKIVNRFKDSFLTLQNLPSNLAELKRKSPPLYETIQGLDEDLLWIKVEFDLAIPNDFFRHTRFYVNCIPVVNRRLINKYVVKRDYDRLPLPMPTENLFLGMNRVWDGLETNTAYKMVDYLNPENLPGTYLLRKGDRIRRMHKKDSTDLIHELLDLITEESSSFKEDGANRLIADFQVIEQAINRIKKNIPQKDVRGESVSDYYCIAHIRDKAYQVNYSYWECQGELNPRIKGKIHLPIRSESKQIDNSFSIVPIQSGKDRKKEESYISLLKSSILSRNKIVTRADIENYCRSHFNDLVTFSHIEQKILPSTKEVSKMERVVLVTLSLKTELSIEQREFLRTNLQNDLNAQSSFFTPIKVQFDQA